MENKMPKGMHEKAVELAKDLIDKGIGMGEIKERTKLSEEKITEVKNELRGRL